MSFWDIGRLIEYYSLYGIALPDTNEYGYSPENPIKVTSVFEQYLYLSKLRYNKKAVYYERIGYLKNFSGNITDKFLIRVKTESVLAKSQNAVAEFVIYINAYSSCSDRGAPKYFTLEEE